MPMSPLTARHVALSALSATLDKRQAAEAALVAARGYADLSAQDRAFAMAMQKTALRRLGQIDALLAAWMESPLPPGAGMVRHALRIGYTQLLFLETPAHAAVHTTVELMRDCGMERFTGLVNALMQRATREGAAAVVAQDAPRLNTPEWLWRSWAEAYGETRARAIAEAHLTEPPLDLTVKDNPVQWAGTLGGEALEGHTVRLRDAGNITQLPGYAEGAWWVQDVAATRPARLLSEAMGGLAGKHIIDLCAAPGGKTAQLAAMCAKVTAVDISENRLRTLRENLTRLQLKAGVVVSDALSYRPDFTPDAILLDAPCSATGTIRRHPDIARHRAPDDILRLANTQNRLIRHALSLLPQGGMLCYAVCSIQPEEGEMQMKALCEQEKTITLLGQYPPFAGGMDEDGFYVGMVRK